MKENKWYYYIIAAPIWLLMLLPFPLLYLLSDILYLLAYYVIGYRKKVVYQNLRNSFPEKTDKEIGRIAKGYYHFMIDLFIETFKTMTMTRKQMVKRSDFTSDGKKVISRLIAENQNFLLVMGHFGNWEWGGHSFCIQNDYELFALYHPIKNKFFDWLTNYIRTKFGMRLINMHHSVREMVKNRHVSGATAFIADQTPSNPKEAFWMTFLNQDTPVLPGTEIIAKKFNYPVVFASVQRKKRGYYQVHFELLCEEPSKTQEGEITTLHTRKLEEEIKRQPEIWLWSHRRWKHKRSV